MIFKLLNASKFEIICLIMKKVQYVVFLFYFGLIARKKNWENNEIVEIKTQKV